MANKITCDQCNMLAINGVATHERGCPNQRKKWDNVREQWIEYVRCHECGDEVEVGEQCSCVVPVEE